MNLSDAEALVLNVALSLDFSQRNFKSEKSLLTAIELYYWGMLLAAELIVPLRMVELTIRSSVHNQMAKRFDDWWFAQPEKIFPGLKWDKMEGSALRRARREADKEHWPLASAEQLVGRTPMNFWVRCFSGKYENQLWHPHLKPLFPDHRIKRRDVHDRLEYLRGLRNRIAHHKLVLPDEGEKGIDAVRYVLQNIKLSESAGFSEIIRMLEVSFSTVELRIDEMRKLMK
jgi:hypothetical protein